MLPQCGKWRRLPRHVELHVVDLSTITCTDCDAPEDIVSSWWALITRIMHVCLPLTKVFVNIVPLQVVVITLCCLVLMYHIKSDQ